MLVSEYERGAEDDQLVTADGGPGGEPLVLQRDPERRVQRLLLHLLRSLVLQERIQAREQGGSTGKHYLVYFTYIKDVYLSQSIPVGLCSALSLHSL